MRKNFQLHKKINYSYEANRDFGYSVIIHCWLHVQFSAPAAIKVIFHTKTSDSVTRAPGEKIEMVVIILDFQVFDASKRIDNSQHGDCGFTHMELV